MKYPLSTKIGIVGGGQLGKMMILEAKKMGFFVAVIDHEVDCPCHSICDELIIADYKNPDAKDLAEFRRLAEMCDVVTYETEHIAIEGLRAIEETKPVYPTPDSLAIIQNKLSQKQELFKHGVAVPEFVEVKNVEDIAAAGDRFGYPLMLKATRHGYDGKGNYTVKSAQFVQEGYDALGADNMQMMAERYLDFDREISVIACRGINGEISIYPIGQNQHQDEVLRETVVPADISDGAVKAAIDVANRVMEIFRGVGIFCVEMFLCRDGSVMVNEIAPRPHNSGHYTIEGCITSQFEQHVRAITGLPLGGTDLIMPSVMRNILGDEGQEGVALVENADKVLEIPGAYLHMYGKTKTAPKRKMGHITALGKTVEEASDKAGRAHAALKIIGK